MDKPKNEPRQMFRPIWLLHALVVAFLLQVICIAIQPNVNFFFCKYVDDTPWGALVIVNDNSIAFKQKPVDLAEFDFYYVDAGNQLPLVYITHYSESANEMWVLPLRDVGRVSIQGKNDMCIRRVYTIAE